MIFVDGVLTQTKLHVVNIPHMDKHSNIKF